MTVTVRIVGSGDAFGSGGRFQTCIVIDGPATRIAIDFGTSSLIALAQQGLHPNTLDAVLLTHLHGDHCGGVPFLVMDAMLAAKRDRPLLVAGPRGVREHLAALQEALFPGSHIMTPKFPLDYRELMLAAPNRMLDAVVTPQAAHHVPETRPTALRVEVAGRTIAYTGDTEWTDDVARIAAGADLLIAECYFFGKSIKGHLTYPAIVDRVRRAGAKRMILTHMSVEMLAHRDDVPEACAADGMVIEL